MLASSDNSETMLVTSLLLGMSPFVVLIPVLYVMVRRRRWPEGLVSMQNRHNRELKCLDSFLLSKQSTSNADLCKLRLDLERKLQAEEIAEQNWPIQLAWALTALAGGLIVLLVLAALKSTIWMISFIWFSQTITHGAFAWSGYFVARMQSGTHEMLLRLTDAQLKAAGVSVPGRDEIRELAKTVQLSPQRSVRAI